MTKYIVHIYREMRLSYTDIEADTPEAAAAFAREKATGEADDIEDCDGDDLSAVVDLAGDEEYRHSVTIDFESERIRKTARALLAVLNRCALLLADYDEQDGEEGDAYRDAIAAIAVAETAGIRPDLIPAKQPSRFEIEHDPLENADRTYVLVDGKFDVAIIRTGEGIVIDVYPKDWIDPIDTMTVWDDDVADAAAETEGTHAAKEA